MERETLTRSLRDLPEMIASAEERVVELETSRRVAEELLRDAEGHALMSGRADGKNGAARAAQLRQLTEERRKYLSRMEEKLALARVEWHREQNRFSAAKALARLLATTTGE